MTDVMLPQVAPPQIVAKPDRAVAKNPESAQKSESNQGFSKALKERMQPEKGNEAKPSDKPKAAESTESRSTEAAPVEAADGKALPATGKAEASVIATQIGTPAPVVAVPSVTELDADLDSGLDTEVPADLEGIVPVVPQVFVPQSTEKAIKPIGVEATPMRQMPVNATLHATLPEPAQSSVAQAVREALAERDAVALTPHAQQRFGAEVRAMAMAQQRGAGFEALLDRVAPVQQTQSTSALPQGLQGVVAQDSTVATARPVLPTTTLMTPFRQPGWDQALSERVLWAASQKLQSAEIRLNPPHLGPIEVRVQMHQDQAQVSFTAQHAVVREALEASMPRLRDMLNASGFNLVDVNVSQHSFAEQQRQAQGFGSSTQQRHDDEDASSSTAASALEISRVGEMSRSGIDLFA